MNTQELNLEMVNRFHNWLNAQRYALSTQERYKRTAENLCLHIGNQPLRKVKPLDIADFITDMQQPSWTEEVVNSHLGALRSFFDFLYFGGVVDSVAPRFLRSRPRVKKLPRAFTQAQVKTFLQAAKHPRDRALVELIYATGCRTGETAAIRIENIDFARCRFLVRAKRKERMVYFGASAAKAIRRYIAKRTGGYLFQSIYPKQKGRLTYCKTSWVGSWKDYEPGEGFGKLRSKYIGKLDSMTRERARAKLTRFLRNANLDRGERGTPLTRSTLAHIVREIARKAGLGHASPKILRHSFATHLVERGASLVAIQALMGHSYLSSTQIYTHISNKTVVTNFRRYHPRGAK